MSSILSSVIGLAFPLILKALDVWMKTKDKNKAMTESYYNFLKQIDAAGAAKVTQYLAAEDALEAKQEELKKEIIEEEKKRNPGVSPAVHRNFTKR